MSALQTLLARLEAATPRERAGLAMIAALGAVALGAFAFDWGMRAQASARAAEHDREQIESVHRRIGQPEFQEEVALATGKVWRWSVVDASAGLAREQASGALESLALCAGLANVSVAAPEEDQAETAQAGLGAFVLTLRADFDWTSYMALLQAIESSELSFNVEAIEVVAGGEAAPALSLRASVPFIREAPP